MAKNEFEELEDDLYTPSATVSEQPVPVNKSGTLIASGSPGEVYNWNDAPTGVKAPPRVDLNGKIVTIKKADIILPPMNREWDKTKDGTKEYKYCSFILYYDINGQQESYSGVRVFKREENGQVMYSHPTIPKDRKSQASKLFGLYADYKKKDLNECSLKEFMAFLNGMPKAKLMKFAVPNPETGAIVEKNIVQEFVN